MPNIVYTISSEESDDDSNEILPRVSDTDAGFVDYETNSDNNTITPNLYTDVEMGDENNLFSEYNYLGEYDRDESNMLVEDFAMVVNNIDTCTTRCNRKANRITTQNKPPSYTFVNKYDAVPLNIDEKFDLTTSDGIIPEVEEQTDKNVKRKSEGTSKGEGKKTSDAALERQTTRQKLEEEKAAKIKASELNKIYKPGECMKYMNIEGHPSLWARWYMTDVPREAAESGAHVLQVHTLCNPALVVWTRTIPRTLDAASGQVKLSQLREPCDRALYIAEAEELCEMVSAHTLSSHLSEIRQLCDCKLTLVVFKLNDYFNAPRRKTSNSNRIPMTEIDFELAIADLLVAGDCDTIIVNTASELALTIVQITKAIAEAPAKKAKRACDEQAAFYMRGDNKKCVAVDKDGVGVGRLWQQMLAILPQSSLETSRAICAQYKSPLALYKSLKSSGGIDKLADTGVSRAAVEGSRARRVGPEFARKLHTLFTAQSGDQLIE